MATSGDPKAAHRSPPYGSASEVANSADFPGAALLLILRAYQITENRELAGSLVLLSCLVYVWLHFHGHLPG